MSIKATANEINTNQPAAVPKKSCRDFSSDEIEAWKKETVKTRLLALVQHFNPQNLDLNLETGEFTITLTSALKGKIDKKLGSEGIQQAAGATLAIQKALKGKIDFDTNEAFFEKDQIVLDMGVIIPNISMTRIVLNSKRLEVEGSCLLGTASMTYTQEEVEATIKAWGKKEVKSK